MRKLLIAALIAAAFCSKAQTTIEKTTPSVLNTKTPAKRKMVSDKWHFEQVGDIITLEQEDGNDALRLDFNRGVVKNGTGDVMLMREVVRDENDAPIMVMFGAFKLTLIYSTATGEYLAHRFEYPETEQQ